MEVPFDILDRFSLPRGMWMTVEQEGCTDDGQPVLTLEIHSTVEDSRRVGQQITVVSPTQIPAYVLDGDENLWKAFVRHCLRAWVLHELDEWLRFDGELVKDPHLVFS